MAEQPRKPSIADDWEEVESTANVQSIASSRRSSFDHSSDDDDPFLAFDRKPPTNVPRPQAPTPATDSTAADVSAPVSPFRDPPPDYELIAPAVAPARAVDRASPGNEASSTDAPAPRPVVVDASPRTTQPTVDSNREAPGNMAPSINESTHSIDEDEPAPANESTDDLLGSYRAASPDQQQNSRNPFGSFIERGSTLPFRPSDSITIGIAAPEDNSTARDSEELRYDAGTQKAPARTEPRQILPPKPWWRVELEGDLGADPEGNDDDASSYSDSSSVDEIANPTLFHTAAASLLKVLSTTSKCIEKFETFESATLDLLQSVVGALGNQVVDFEPILQAYSKHWVAHGSGMAAGEIPINASLLEWMNNTSSELLATQTELERVRGLTAAAPAFSNVDAYASEEELGRRTYVLKESYASMKEFLPIIKCDFDRFKTNYMNFPPARSEGESSGSRCQPPHPAVARLRRELYSLKDHVDMLHREIQYLQFKELTKLRAAGPVLESLKTVSQVITTILTNHASEWIVSDLDTATPGVLSYADFISISPDVLNDVGTHLKNVCDQVGLDLEPDENSLYPEIMKIRHQVTMLTEGGHLEELASIVSFLQSLLVPGQEAE